MGKPKRYNRWFNRRPLDTVKHTLKGAAYGTLIGGIPGLFIGGFMGAKKGLNQKYDMVSGEVVEGNNFGNNANEPNPFASSKRQRTPSGPFILNKRGKFLPQNFSSMAYTPYRRTPRSTGSSLFRSRSSFASRRSYGGLRRSRFQRRFRYRYRPSRRGNRFRGRFRKSRFFRRRRTIKRKAFRRRKMVKRGLKGMTIRSKGYQTKYETFGKVEDDHCAYIKHSTWNLRMIAQSIAAAVYRKLFKKIGYDIGDHDTIVTALGVTSPDASAYRILFVWADPNVGNPPQQIGTSLAVGATIESLAKDTTANTFYPFLLSYLLNQDQSEPLNLQLQLVDKNTGADIFHTLSSLNLQNEYFYFKCSSVLRVQNRTLSAGVGTTNPGNTDVVDNQPLSGKVMTFKHGDPRLRWTTMTPWTTLGSDYILNGIHHDGIDKVGANGLPNKYKEPPTKDTFANCLSSKKFILNVGQCMQTSVGWSAHGRFVNVLKKFRPQRGGFTGSPADPDRVVHVAGKSQIMVVEEYIRTENSNKISLGYEVEYQCGSWFQTKSPTSFHTAFDVVATAQNYP